MSLGLHLQHSFSNFRSLCSPLGLRLTLHCVWRTVVPHRSAMKFSSQIPANRGGRTMRGYKLFLVLAGLPLFAVPCTQAQDKSSSGCWPWPDSLDAVAADPQNHIVLYEDSKIRVLDVHTPPRTM